MCLSTGTNLTALGDNGTYEATIFGDRAVSLITDHDKPDEVPFFMYLVSMIPAGNRACSLEPYQSSGSRA
eukprot:SAG22_NODE_72_length_22344_cov_95.586559_5_plen_70_part_00